MMAAMTEHRLRILHVSDLHLDGESSGPGGWRRKRVFGAEWEKNLAAIVDDGPIDLICFTGDLVQSGKPSEYAALTPFVENLLAHTGVAHDRLFVVPGNHDIDRSIAKPAWKKLRGLGDGEALSRLMAVERVASRPLATAREDILKRQGAYRAWVRDGLRRPELLPTPDQHPRLGYRVSLRLPGHPFDMHVIGLDSAWLAGDDGDARKLHVTRDQVGYLADGLAGFRLALVHHPLGELADGEVCRDLLAERVDLLLRGHLHDTRLGLWSEPDRQLREVATGCLYQSDRYPNGCTVLELRLDDEGRPCRPSRFWFRGWAERGFWTDEDRLYPGSKNGRLTWPAEDDTLPPAARPADCFVGRTHELVQLAEALLPAAGPPLPVAVVALQGMPGVGKSFLVDRFAQEHRGRFPGGYHVVALEPDAAHTVDMLGGRLATLVGQHIWGGPGAWGELVARLQAPAALVHVENVDGDEPIAAVLDLARRLGDCALVISGRSRRFGRQPPFQVLEIQPLDEATALEQLTAELGPARDAVDTAARRRLVRVLGYLPLALHLAAGYLMAGHSVGGFLDLLSAQGLALEPADLDDPLFRLDRARAVLSTTFALSLDLLQRRFGSDGVIVMAGFAALGHAPTVGVRSSLGAAMAGLDEVRFEALMVEAVRLSLASGTANAGWSIHPLLAKLLRGRVPEDAWRARMTAWFLARLPLRSPSEEDVQGRCWGEIHQEGAALELWLPQVPGTDLARVAQAGSRFAMMSGPFAQWMTFYERLLGHTTHPSERSNALWTLAYIAHRAGALDRAADAAASKRSLDLERGAEREAALAAGVLADILAVRGELDEALRICREEQLPVFERLGDFYSRALSLGKVADILEARGEIDEALRIRREEQLPVFDRLRDMRSRAVTLGKVADILEARGELYEALRIRREEELPAYERLGDRRSRAITLGKVAGFLQAHGDRDEALRILREDLLPEFERLGDVRARAVTLGRVADILGACGDLDEALRIRREEQLPVYERLGDVRARAITLGRVADILEARGNADEALRIRREEQLPVYERLGDVRSWAATLGKMADILQERGEMDEALHIRREEELPVYERLGDVRARAITLGKVADILAARGELDEALRIHREEELPVYERLGDVRERANMLGKVADILEARGSLDEALRIRRTELPVYERLGDMLGLVVGRTNLALTLLSHNASGDREEAARLLELALQAADAMKIPEAETIRAIQCEHSL
jgi:tetratricopeptide (TPR) repeat protein